MLLCNQEKAWGQMSAFAAFDWYRSRCGCTSLDLSQLPVMCRRLQGHQVYVDREPGAAAPLVGHGNRVQPCCDVQVIAKASDAFSAGDLVNKRVRMHQSWSLMPFAAVIGSVFPAAYMRGSRETFGLYPNEMNFPR